MSEEEGNDLMPWLVPFLVALGTVSLFIVTGNILVIMTFLRDRTLRNPTGLIIISLASSDFITGLIAVPSVLLSMVPDLKIFVVDPGCWISGVLVHSLFSCSLLNLTLISLQRYYLITRPHNNIFNKIRVKLMIIGLWIYSFGSSLIVILPGFNGYILYGWSLSCIMNYGPEDNYLTKYYGSTYNSLTFLVTSLTILVTQYRILRIIFSRTKSTKSSSDSKRQLSEQRRFYATKMISCMILGFAICIVPIMIMMFMKVAERIPPKQYAAFCGFMVWFNSLVNPTIYWYFNRTYSASLRRSMKQGKDRVLRNTLIRDKSFARISLIKRISQSALEVQPMVHEENKTQSTSLPVSTFTP